MRFSGVRQSKQRKELREKREHVVDNVELRFETRLGLVVLLLLFQGEGGVVLGARSLASGLVDGVLGLPLLLSDAMRFAELVHVANRPALAKKGEVVDVHGLTVTSFDLELLLETRSREARLVVVEVDLAGKRLDIKRVVVPHVPDNTLGTVLKLDDGLAIYELDHVLGVANCVKMRAKKVERAHECKNGLRHHAKDLLRQEHVTNSGSDKHDLRRAVVELQPARVLVRKRSLGQLATQQTHTAKAKADAVPVRVELRNRLGEVPSGNSKNVLLERLALTAAGERVKVAGTVDVVRHGVPTFCVVKRGQCPVRRVFNLVRAVVCAK